MKVKFLKNILLGVFLSLTLGNLTAHAATKYWIGPGGGSFLDNANWSTTPGGANDTTAPTTGDVGTFTSDVVTNCQFPIGNVLAQVSTSAGYTGSLLSANGTVFTTTVTLNDGNLLAGTGSLTFTGNLNLTGGDFDAETATVTFNNNAQVTINSAASLFDATDATLLEFNTTLNSVSINADVGTFEMPSGTMRLEGFWSQDPGFTTNHNNGTVYLDGDDDGSFLHNLPGTTTLQFYDLIIDKTNNNDNVTLDTGNTFNVEVLNTLTLNNGLLNGGTSATIVSTLSAEKDLVWNSTFDGGTGVLTIRTENNETIPNVAESPGLQLDSSNALSLPLTVTFTGSTNVDFDSLIIIGTDTILDNTTTNDGGGDAIDLSMDGGTFTCTGTFNDGDGNSLTFGSSNVTLGDDCDFDAGTGTWTQTGDLIIDDSSTAETPTNIPTLDASGLTTMNLNNTVNQAIDLMDGSFYMPNGTLNMLGGWTEDVGFDLNEGTGTLSFNHTTSKIFTLSQNETFNNLTINSTSSLSLNDGTGLNTVATVNGLFTMQNGTVGNANMSIYAAGTVDWQSGWDGGLGLTTLATTSNVTIPNGAGCQAMTFDNINKSDLTVTYSGASSITCQSIAITNNSNTGATFTFNGTNSTTELTVNAGITVGHGVFQNTGNGFIDLNSTFVMNGGTFTNGSVAGSIGNETLNVSTTFTINNGTFNLSSGNANLASTGTMAAGIFNGQTGDLQMNSNFFTMNGGTFNAGTTGTLDFHTLQMNGSSIFNGQSKDLDFNSASASIDLNSGTFNAGSNTVDAAGDLDQIGGTFNGETATITLADDLILATSAVAYFGTGNSISADAATFQGAGTDVDCQTTTLNINTFSMTTLAPSVDCSSATMNVNSTSATLAMNFDTGTMIIGDATIQGGWDQESSASVSAAGGTTVTFEGGDKTYSNGGATTKSFYNLTVDLEDSLDELTYIDNMDINGDLFISHGVLANQNDNINIAGDWTLSGDQADFSAATTGTVIFDGTDQSIFGSTTFRDFTKSVSSADTLTLQSGETQTILGAMTLNGVAGELLTVRSDMCGVEANIDPQGTRTINFLQVQDINNVNATEIATSGFNVTDGGNNTNWEDLIAGPNCIFYSVPEFSTYLYLLTLMAGLVFAQYKYGNGFMRGIRSRV